MRFQKMRLDGGLGLAAQNGMFRHALIAFLAAVFPLASQGFDTSYWVWHRTAPLSEGEIGELHSQNVATLYWGAGEISNTGSEWKWKTPPLPQQQGVAGLAFVPVVRITSWGKDPFTEASVAALVEKLRPIAAANKELQIDFDCPDRLLGEYAKALKKIRAVAPRLSITALAGWSRGARWKEFEGSVDEIFTMFYDLGPEPNPAGGGAQPLVDAKTNALIADWAGCTIPWMAGLPSFARLTVFDTQGRSRGNIRQWGWDDVCFNKYLTNVKSGTDGVAMLQAARDCIITSTPLKQGELLAARWPARAALVSAADAAQKAGARGVTYFGLPDGTDPAGWSLKQMGCLASQDTPGMLLREKAPGHLTLANDSGIDLEPRLDGSGGEGVNGAMDRGYELEIDADAPVFREALAGDFWKVTGYANPATKPALVAIPLATRLTFWFSHLRAGESLDCGLIQLAPNVAFKQIRWRILQLGGTWHPIE